MPGGKFGILAEGMWLRRIFKKNKLATTPNERQHARWQDDRAGFVRIEQLNFDALLYDFGNGDKLQLGAAAQQQRAKLCAGLLQHDLNQSMEQLLANNFARN